VTFDEDDRSEDNHIATIVAGARVKPGRYPARFDHYHLLRTLQEMYGLAPTGAAAQRPAIRGIFTEFSAPRS
jgi:acid phosphatase